MCVNTARTTIHHSEQDGSNPTCQSQNLLQPSSKCFFKHTREVRSEGPEPLGKEFHLEENKKNEVQVTIDVNRTQSALERD